MKITRMDLADTGSPMGLATKILSVEKDLPIPVPIEALAHQLDIEKIAALTTAGFEGGLLTDEDRSTGIILVNQAAPEGRRRFTIGHELGHFLIATHKPVESGKFLCSRADMAKWSIEQTDRYARMEAEANEFSGLILIPPPALRRFISKGDPTLQHVPLIAKHFNVSKEAAARAYARYHPEEVAIVVIKDGVVKRVHKRPTFPWISVPYGKPVPKASLYYRKDQRERVAGELSEILPEHWVDLKPGQRAELFEQTYPQQNGYALLMLWLELEEVEEEDDERTSKQRYQDQQSRWR
ncbi:MULTISPECIES: ImmA/IrrE family metallo-endopeptidase [unclassified Bradyrhizobium]|uniref:ImmA/IrrE family metallo-endopeptidase n=1 Tax=unclassified Bradyrhizobium TaxID=2631580 RepID=UPI0028EDF3E9|nr:MULTISPECIES: ImmA/IrrE family metallo-endopeptidase [unclassified Bradyrhizobium]